DLGQFFLTGNKADVKTPHGALSGLRSVYTANHAKSAKRRIDFPLVLPDDLQQHVVPLSEFIDSLIEKNDGEGEAVEELKHYLLLVENALRQKCLEKSADITASWGEAVKQVVSAARIDKTKKQELKSKLADLFEQDAVTGELLAFDPEMIQRLFSRIYTKQTAKLSADFLQKSKDLLQLVRDVLITEFDKSDAAKTPDQLSGQLAADEFKLDAFAGLMGHIGDRAESQPRIKRLQNTEMLLAEMIEKMEDGELTVSTDLSSGLQQYEKELKKFIEYFKARQIALLEVENKYEPGSHDEFFEKFDLRNVSLAEQALIWPAVIYLKQDQLDAERIAEILRIAHVDMPVKVIIEMNQALEPAKTAFEAIQSPSAANSLLRTLLHENQTYVGQAALSDVKGLKSAFKKGLQYQGPAFCGIFVGKQKNASDRLTEVMGTTHSRVSPVFSSNPGKGSTWAEKFCLKHNESYDQDWTEARATFIDENGSSKEVTETFTVLDFLTEQTEYADHCVAVEPGILTDSFVPAARFLQKGGSVTGIPYVLKYNDKGQETAIIVTQFLVNLAQKLLLNWRGLQELAGINNSHVIAQMAIAEEQQAKALADKEVELEAAYQAKLDSALGALADDIVGNIASGLLGQATVPVAAPAAAAPKPVAATPADEVQDTVEAEPEPEVEEDDMSFDEAYIDTPLCTSCNECVQRNKMIFEYDGNKQAFIKDASAGPFRDIVEAAEKCPVKIIHPGKPINPDESGLDDLIKRAAVFN
ncbi:MAG: ferredoxin, partial [Calditrichaeota bacterium]